MGSQEPNRGMPARTGLTDAQREAIFARRAEELAAPPGRGAEAEDLEVVVFALGREQYAFPRTQVREVRPLVEVTPLPGAPPFVMGLINLRGRILAVIDLRPLFGLRADGGSLDSLVLVRHARGDVAILATGRPAVRGLRSIDLGPIPEDFAQGLHPDYVRGVTRDLVVVLDLEHMLADPRLVMKGETPQHASQGGN